MNSEYIEARAEIPAGSWDEKSPEQQGFILLMAMEYIKFLSPSPSPYLLIDYYKQTFPHYENK